MDIAHLYMVYDADSGLRGEAAYVFGMLRGRHCGLCDISHGIVREKSAFRDLTCSLSIPVDVWHRNEQTPEVARFTAGITPCVVGRSGAELVVLLDAVELEAMDGDVDRFARELRARMEAGAHDQV